MSTVRSVDTPGPAFLANRLNIGFLITSLPSPRLHPIDHRILRGDPGPPCISYSEVIALGPVVYSYLGVPTIGLRPRDYLLGYIDGYYDRFTY